jgi:hypothetical protein
MPYVAFDVNQHYNLVVSCDSLRSSAVVDSDRVPQGVRVACARVDDEVGRWQLLGLTA